MMRLLICGLVAGLVGLVVFDVWAFSLPTGSPGFVTLIGLATCSGLVASISFGILLAERQTRRIERGL